MDYIPLQAAAKKYGVDEQVLTQLISAGMIDTRTGAGGTLVAVKKNGNSVKNETVKRTDEPQTKEEIIAAKFSNLIGQPISAHGAQKKYGVHYQNFINWTRAGVITVLGASKNPLQLDSADVAYCVFIYESKKKEYGGNIAGVRLFEDNGNPYQVKHPALAMKRRK